MGWYREKVDPKAFARTLSRNPDVRLLINHDGLPLARTISGTLSFEADAKGLKYRAGLDPTDPDVQSLIPKMRRGDLSGSSFSFRVFPHGDVWNADLSERTLTDLDIDNGDVSVVTYPANPRAAASVRAAGTDLDAIYSAMTVLENRAAPAESMISVLTRALAFFQAIDLIADEAAEDLGEALGIPDDDCCDCGCELCDPPADPAMADPGADPVMDPAMAGMSGANAAKLQKELRARILAL
jgi:HK97 family phage prohead protease